MSRIQNAILIFLAIGALLGAFFLLSQENERETRYISPVILVNDHLIPISIARSERERQKGLSGTSSLDSGSGKFFVFDKSGRYGFWMKDMNYPIDIVWIDESFKIVAVNENVRPESYPNIFYPPQEVRYVLELNAYEAKKMRLSEGISLELKNYF